MDLRTSVAKKSRHGVVEATTLGKRRISLVRDAKTIDSPNKRRRILTQGTGEHDLVNNSDTFTFYHGPDLYSDDDEEESRVKQEDAEVPECNKREEFESKEELRVQLPQDHSLRTVKLQDDQIHSTSHLQQNEEGQRRNSVLRRVVKSEPQDTAVHLHDCPPEEDLSDIEDQHDRSGYPVYSDSEDDLHDCNHHFNNSFQECTGSNVFSGYCGDHCGIRCTAYTPTPMRRHPARGNTSNRSLLMPPAPMLPPGPCAPYSGIISPQQFDGVFHRATLRIFGEPLTYDEISVWRSIINLQKAFLSTWRQRVAEAENVVNLAINTYNEQNPVPFDQIDFN